MARYALYYPEEGRMSIAMTLKEAKKMLRQFPTAFIVSITAKEIYGV